MSQVLAAAEAYSQGTKAIETIGNNIISVEVTIVYVTRRRLISSIRTEFTMNVQHVMKFDGLRRICSKDWLDYHALNAKEKFLKRY